MIASSKSWFKLHDDIAEGHNVTFIDDYTVLSPCYLETLKPDIIFFPHWNWKVGPEIHKNYHCIVFHTAPLPYGRGGSPIQNLILEGHEYVPVCALQMTDDMDAGAIYASRLISLEGRLRDIFKRINDSVNQLIADLVSGVLPHPVPQKGEPHYFKRRSDTDNQIPEDIDLKQIFDRIRMLDDESYPRSFITHGDYRIEFSDAEFDGNKIIASCSIHKC